VDGDRVSGAAIEGPARLVLHIVRSADWAAAAAGPAYEADSLAREGFIHLSTPDQVLLAADTHYRGEPDLVLLCIDPTRLDAAQLRFEAGSPPNQHLIFPHLYGPLPVRAVTAILPFPAGPDGRFQLPAELPG
jgi:uncharacterized protein (DUF952 family)